MASSCASATSASVPSPRHSTIGTERLSNYALQIANREDFIAELTANLPARPEYFLQDAELNRAGAEPLAELPPPRALTPREVKDLARNGAVLLDTRPPD